MQLADPVSSLSEVIFSTFCDMHFQQNDCKIKSLVFLDKIQDFYTRVINFLHLQI